MTCNSLDRSCRIDTRHRRPAVMHFLYDSHCHLHVEATATLGCCPGGDPNVSEQAVDDMATDTACDVAKATFDGGLLCSTHPAVDWDAISSLCNEAVRKAHVGFGVHPWYAGPEGTLLSPPSIDQLDAARPAMSVDDTIALLERLLLAHPRAWVAEIGLDKLRGDQKTQIQLFHAQLALAGKLSRPVSVHCVRSFGALLTTLSTIKPPLPVAIVLHAYTGSAEFTNSLLKLPKIKSDRIYFGVNSQTTGTLADVTNVIARIPKDRVLLESDYHYRLPPPPRKESSPLLSYCMSAQTGSSMEAFVATLPDGARGENFRQLLRKIGWNDD